MGMQTGLHNGSARYVGTGRTFPLTQDSLLAMYKNYARSHYHHALQVVCTYICMHISISIWVVCIVIGIVNCVCILLLK
jgi:hypothetical protein